jgi:hypothetical protein
MEVADTPEAIEYFSLSSLKGRVKLEAQGMKCNGPSAMSIARKRFNLSARAGSKKILAAIQDRMDTLVAERQAKCG